MRIIVSLDTPRDHPDLVHDAATCAAWADEQRVPRAVACSDHWESDDDRKARDERLAAWRDLPAAPDSPAYGSTAWAMEETGLRPGMADR